MILRLEEVKDYRKVEHLIREAFWNVYKPGCDEHYIMHILRNDPCFVKELSYVVEENNEIIGQIAYALGTLEKENGEVEDMLLFGPVCAHPDKQKQGIGSLLINETIKISKEMGYACVVITGNPKYYHRFGFEPAFKYDIFHSDMPKDSPYFMVKVLDESKIKNLKGIYYEPSCYYANKEDVEEFDKQYPSKIKEKKPGQLV